jgi:hypothetical protein
VALPGEKLSRAAAVAAPSAAPDDLDIDAEDMDDELEPTETSLDGPVGEESAEETRRRRRRRGGRGRGRSRGREEGAFVDAPAGASDEEVIVDPDDIPGEADEMPAPARRAASAFGSVWDSQIGTPAGRRQTPALDDEEDFPEPAIPEYLITERRQRDGGRGGGAGRGRGGAYAAALDRERFGGGRGSRPSSFNQPAPAPREGGFNRPDRGGRNDRVDRIDRGDRGGQRPPFRPAPAPAPRGSGDEPWSEVPPEIEAMLRAQLGSRPAPQRAAPAADPVMESASPAPARRGRRPAAAEAEAPMVADDGGPATAEAPAKARRTPARRTRAAAAKAEAGTTDTADATPTAKPAAKRASAAAKPRTTRAKAAAPAAETSDAGADVAPKRRAPRKKADPSA